MATQTPVFTTKICALLIVVGAGCSNSSGSPVDSGTSDLAAGAKNVVINEVFPHGAGGTDTDWVELKNIGDTEVVLTGYQVRDEKLADLAYLPDGTSIAAGGYLIVNCIGTPDAGVPPGLVGVNVPFKLSGNSGDEFHLVGLNGADVDETVFGIDVPSDKSWGRLPDGTGIFVRTTPTKALPNI